MARRDSWGVLSLLRVLIFLVVVSGLVAHGKSGWFEHGASARQTTPASTAGILTDSDLLSYALSGDRLSFDCLNSGVQALGLHRGTPVAVELLCTDFHPVNTVRLIRYELARNRTCESVGGELREFVIPISIYTAKKEFCFPKPITNAWSRYVSVNGLMGELRTQGAGQALKKGRPQ